MSWPPEITVAAIVTRNDTFLMVEEIDHGDLVINQPAGHLEPNESLVEAMMRRCSKKPATSLDLRPSLVSISSRRRTMAHYILEFATWPASLKRPNKPLTLISKPRFGLPKQTSCSASIAALWLRAVCKIIKTGIASPSNTPPWSCHDPS